MFRLTSKFDPHRKQRAKLLELGVYLQQVRSEQGISLDTISRKTLIPRHFLEAIELGDLDSLPEPITIRWLIKQFSDALALDGEEISQRFPINVKPLLSLSRLSISFPRVQIRPIHLYFVYIFLMVVSVQTISHLLQQSILQANRLPPPTLPEQQTARTQPKNSARPVTSKPPVNNGQVVVDVKLKDDCWLKVVIDGKTEFEGILPQGTHRTWQATKELKVRAGNAGGVYVAVNNANAKQLGQPGKVEEVTYKAN